MSGQKKILILYTSVGLGHKAIGENIGASLERAGYQVKLADIGKVQKGKFEKIVVGIHQFINNHLPFVWDFLYNWGHYLILPFRVFIAGFNYKATKILVDEFAPDIIITTQTTASAVVAYLKQQGFYNGKFAIAFSDYHLHRYWLYDEADFYLANIEEQKKEMITLGVPENKVFVTGFNLKPHETLDRAAIKTKLGIEYNRKVVLMASGSLGIGLDETVIKQISKMSNVSLLVLCGKNKEMFEYLSNKFSGTNVLPLSFYTPLDELFAITDLFLSKPGGVSIAEALRWHLPILIFYMLPGQEQYNYDYLLKKNLVKPKSQNLTTAIEQELHGQEFKKQLQQNPAVKLLVGQENVLLEAVSKALF